MGSANNAAALCNIFRSIIRIVEYTTNNDCSCFDDCNCDDCSGCDNCDIFNDCNGCDTCDCSYIYDITGCYLPAECCCCEYDQGGNDPGPIQPGDYGQNATSGDATVETNATVDSNAYQAPATQVFDANVPDEITLQEDNIATNETVNNISQSNINYSRQEMQNELETSERGQTIMEAALNGENAYEVDSAGNKTEIANYGNTSS